jgi:hypothetical protein
MGRIVKKICTLTVVATTLILGGCGNSKSSSTNPNSQSIAAKWNFTAVDQNNNIASFALTLVPSPCTVTAGNWTFTVQGPSCFIADNQTGQGSATLIKGNPYYPIQGALVGTPSNPMQSGAQVDMLFVEGQTGGGIAVFGGNGQFSSGSVQGEWSCNSSTPVCGGTSGTFIGTLQ